MCIRFDAGFNCLSGLFPSISIDPDFVSQSLFFFHDTSCWSQALFVSRFIQLASRKVPDLKTGPTNLFNSKRDRTACLTCSCSKTKQQVRRSDVSGLVLSRQFRLMMRSGPRFRRVLRN